MKTKKDLIKELEEIKKWNSLWKDTLSIQSQFIGLVRHHTFDSMPINFKKEDLKRLFRDNLDSKMNILHEKYSELLRFKITN